MERTSNDHTSLPFTLEPERRKTIGRITLATSGLLFVIAVLAATTNTLAVFALNTWQSWEVAGAAGGIALPTVIAGIFILLPSNHAERRLAIIGSTIALLGVFLYVLYFPNQWHNDPTDYTFRVTATYFLGAFAAISAVFFSVSNIDIQTKTEVVFHQLKSEARNVINQDPPEHNSKPRRDTTPQSEPGKPEQAANSGVGFIGNPEQQPEESRDAEIIDGDTPETPEEAVDRYCGNCEHFQYKHVGDSLQPYCGFHNEAMDDLDACTDWSGTTDD